MRAKSAIGARGCAEGPAVGFVHVAGGTVCSSFLIPFVVLPTMCSNCTVGFACPAGSTSGDAVACPVGTAAGGSDGPGACTPDGPFRGPQLSWRLLLSDSQAISCTGCTTQQACALASPPLLLLPAPAPPDALAAVVQWGRYLCYPFPAAPCRRHARTHAQGPPSPACLFLLPYHSDLVGVCLLRKFRRTIGPL